MADAYDTADQSTQLFATPLRLVGSGTTIEVLKERTIINLRLDSDDVMALDAVAAVLGTQLPLDANTCAGRQHRACWLGPDEWLVVSGIEEGLHLGEELTVALAGNAAAVNDLSGGYICLSIRGTGARDLLASGCTLDLHPSVFHSPMCAQTGLGRAGVLIAAISDEPLFEVIVRRSFADYLCRWLRHAICDECH